MKTPRATENNPIVYEYTHTQSVVSLCVRGRVPDYKACNVSIRCRAAVRDDTAAASVFVRVCVCVCVCVTSTPRDTRGLLAVSASHKQST